MPSSTSAALACVFCAGCGVDLVVDMGSGSGRDGAFVFDPIDAGEEPDLFTIVEPDPCGDDPPDANCFVKSIDAPFPLHDDAKPDPAVRDDGLMRNGQGYLRLSAAGGTGTYLVLVRGCFDGGTGEAVDTMWWRVNWDGDRPQGTSIQVRAESGPWTKIDDPGWQQTLWTKPESSSPLDLQWKLKPNVTPGDPGVPANDGMLRVEVQLSSQVAGRTPVLKHLDVGYKCGDLR